VIPLSHHGWGFAAAIGLMLLSAVLPWWAFKRLGWL
jgi:Mg2+ and Co2+ transporter CorA